MTTIVWKPPFMASDGRVTVDNLIFTDKCPKIYKLSSGGLMGFSGAMDSRPIVDLFDKLKSPRLFPSPKEISDYTIDFRAILVLPTGIAYLVESGPDYTDEDGEKHRNVWYSSIMEINEPYFACGSGSKWAKAALDMGAAADKAVRVAMKNDATSGGKVQIFELIQKTKKAPK